MIKDRLEYQRKWHNDRKLKLPSVISMNGEIWKDIFGYEGDYMVSNLGRVKRLTSTIPNKRWGSMNVQEKLLSPSNCRGYKYCKLSKEGVSDMFLVSRLVAIHFIDNPENKPEVNHLKEKWDNRAISLEWSTKKENMEHSVINGLHKSGVNHHKAILNEKQVIAIFKNKLSERKIAKIYNISRPTVNAIKSGRSWAKVTNAYKQLL